MSSLSRAPHVVKHNAAYRYAYLNDFSVLEWMGWPGNQGIAENFIGILRTEERTASRGLLRLVLFALVVGLLAALAVDLPSDGRFFGIAVGLVALAILGGGVLGNVLGRHVFMARYHKSLATNWNRWMRYSVACSRVDEVQRRVQGKPATRSIAAVATMWTLILFTTAILLLMTVVDGVPTIDKTPVFVAYGAYSGYLIGRTIAMRAWARDFLVSIDEMMRQGEIGLWGVL